MASVAVHAWRPPRDPSVYAIVDIPVQGALAYIDQVREATGVRVTVTHTWSPARSRSASAPSRR